MSVPLLGTKLFLPRPGRGRVARPRLLGRLDRVTESTLTLVSAPPGFGKTTLLAEWAAAIGAPPSPAAVAWLSLDDADNDPATFWTYVVAALRTAAPAVGTEATALLSDPQPPPVETVLTSLVNDVSASEADLVLVLDDYHVIGNLEIHAGLEFLRRPPAAAAPPGHRQPVRPAPSPRPAPRPRRAGRGARRRPAVHRPRRRRRTSTTPWACPSARTTSARSAVAPRAGSQPSSWPPCRSPTVPTRATSSPASPETTATSSTTSSKRCSSASNRDVQSFLLQTSVLERLTGPLCDAVTGENGGKAMLERLERDNLFVVPLDDNRRWYRYHHLFADVLRARLLDEQPQDVAGLHRRASAWFEQNGDRGAGDPARDLRGRRRDGGGPDRAGDAGHAPRPARTHAPHLARGAAARGGASPAGPVQRAGRGDAVHRQRRRRQRLARRSGTVAAGARSIAIPPSRPSWSTPTSIAGCPPTSPSTGPVWRW